MLKQELKHFNFDDLVAGLCKDRCQTIPTPDVALVCGVSAVGKSTLINELISKHPDKLGYVTPYTTRPLREGECGKVSITLTDFHDRQRNGEFVHVKDYYGFQYGMSGEVLSEIKNTGRLPIVDFPLSDVCCLRDRGINTDTIYVFPYSIQEWYERLAKSGRNIRSRIEIGIRELYPFVRGQYSLSNLLDVVNFALINRDGAIADAALRLENYLGLNC